MSEYENQTEHGASASQHILKHQNKLSICSLENGDIENQWNDIAD